MRFTKNSQVLVHPVSIFLRHFLPLGRGYEAFASCSTISNSFTTSQCAILFFVSRLPTFSSCILPAFYSSRNTDLALTYFIRIFNLEEIIFLDPFKRDRILSIIISILIQNLLLRNRIDIQQYNG